MIYWPWLSEKERRYEKPTKFYRIPGFNGALKKFVFTVSSILIFLFASAVLFIFSIGLNIYRKCHKRWVEYVTKNRYEILDVTTETVLCSEQDSIILFCSLIGAVNFTKVEQSVQNFINKEKISHLNLKKNLSKIQGFFALQEDEKFELKNHLQRGPIYFQGCLLSHRNIQQYISTVSNNTFPSDHPPWKIVVCYGIGEYGEEKTWIIIKAHKLLAQDITIEEISPSFPNPWNINAKRADILSAPVHINELSSVIKNYFSIYCKFWLNSLNKVQYIFNKSTINAIIDYINTLKIACLQILFPIRICNNGKILEISRIWVLINILAAFHTSLIIIIIAMCHVKLLIEKVINYLLYLLEDLDAFIIKVIYFFNLVINACLEVYWIIRGIISLPRLILEEIIDRDTISLPRPFARKTLGRKFFLTKRTDLNVSWSDEMPISVAHNVMNASGSCISSVILAAIGRAVQEVMKLNGVIPYKKLKCTFPVYVPSHQGIYGLLSSPLPTSASTGKIALQQSHTSMEELRNYPERFLASIWLRKYIPYCLPVFVIRSVTKYLTSSNSIFLTYLVLPEEPKIIWEHLLEMCYIWRPPQQNAALSICVTSYHQNINVGVLVNGWSVQNGGSLSEIISKHFRELVLEHGAHLERRKCSPDHKEKRNSTFNTFIGGIKRTIRRKRSSTAAFKLSINNNTICST